MKLHENPSSERRVHARG